MKTTKEKELETKDGKRLGDVGTSPEVTRGSMAGSSNNREERGDVAHLTSDCLSCISLS